MQIIVHKNKTLTFCQRFFIEKSLELLHIGSIDTYRVGLNNPRSILEELKYCLEQFQKGRIKHFHTIKGKEKQKAIVDEAILMAESCPNYLTFHSISPIYLIQLLKKADEHNYKKIISCIDILLKENKSYLKTVTEGLESLISKNTQELCSLEEIDNSINILLSELITTGFDKGFLYRLTHGIFVKSLTQDKIFTEHFNNFKKRILEIESEYMVIFRVDTTRKVIEAITDPPRSPFFLTKDIDDVQVSQDYLNEFSAFNSPVENRIFIRCKDKATDHMAALKKGRNQLSEYLDVINLGLSGEFLQIHPRVLVNNIRSRSSGGFQINTNFMDGKYTVEKEHYQKFANRLPLILNSPEIEQETKEKIKSAIRYLRLGNQSTEVEHKFINYWIGLEYLFSNYESQSTISRIKEHFINAHSLAYVKRNLHRFQKSFTQLSPPDKTVIPSRLREKYLETETFYLEISQQLLQKFPLLAYRAMKLQKWFFRPNRSADTSEYLKSHRNNLEIHLTRIYRLRNEIIHDAATNMNNEQIASNLRYYLTFILNELIDFFYQSEQQANSIEQYFILNEIKIGNIEQNGFLLRDLLAVECSLDFIS
ncbi:MAG: hypothetical protein P0Y53_08260 [Candidatus Pseudobacter hemicellulosilyticus]|uniref:Apea-like HEPN domain-containing protein n=1 Tax=Candidatus Pseudobacter hemicellulosilyticus TaxID=3121375 RepID=A0AAJ5WVT3_9BACT|nr:MAG: hypothetical protein P0Y53_08260 [Pseudobacter sp.]